jgi:hypothetical protein
MYVSSNHHDNEEADMAQTQNKQHYFAGLEGKTIKRVTTLGKADLEDFGWDYCDPEETTVIIFTDDTVAVVMQDPEGNGPGWLETGELA